MSTNAAIGYGTQLEYSLDAGATWTALAEVLDIKPPSDSVETIDATHMGSANRTREYIEGLNDPGECSFEMNFVPGSAADVAVQSFRGAGAVYLRLIFPNGTIWTFQGVRTSYEPAIPVEGKMTASVGFKVTGSYVATAAAVPVVQVKPAISGIPQVGVLLTAFPGVWSNGPSSYTYQWKKAGTNIAGATNKTYTPVSGDIGGALTVSVIAVNTAGSSVASLSGATANVIA